MNLRRFKSSVFCYCYMLISLFICANSYANGNVQDKHLIDLEKRFSNFKDDSSTEEVLLMLSDAETVCRLVVTFEISEEGGNYFQIGQFVEKLIEKNRWDVIFTVLKHHFYYPQTTNWLLEIYSYKNTEYKNIMSDFYDKVGDTNRLIDKFIKSLEKKVPKLKGENNEARNKKK